MLLLTPGDPRGIGPEVAVRALADRAEGSAPVVLLGDPTPVAEALRVTGAPLAVDPVPDLLTALRRARPWSAGGSVPWVDTRGRGEPAEVAAIRAATVALRDGVAEAGLAPGRAGGALVTGPIHKKRLADQGFGFTGHTDFLGHLCGVERPVMAFAGGTLRVALATVHLPLRDVADALTVEGLVHTVVTAARALVADLGVAAPRVVVCGLNPHAGDGGLLGREEIDTIAPAVRRASAELVDGGWLREPVVGPLSAEHAFRLAGEGTADLVVAMYHDQGLAPLKLVDFGRSVNWTLGLPIHRTSVDHGTADDLVGQGVADSASMASALALAEQLVRQARAQG